VVVVGGVLAPEAVHGHTLTPAEQLIVLSVEPARFPAGVRPVHLGHTVNVNSAASSCRSGDERRGEA